MKKMNIVFNCLLIFAIMLILPQVAQAQNFNDALNDAPIDGGLSLLIAAGVGYGAKRIKETRNNKQNKPV